MGALPRFLPSLIHNLTQYQAKHRCIFVLFCSGSYTPIQPLSIGGEFAVSTGPGQVQKEERSDETAPNFATSHSARIDGSGSEDRAEVFTSLSSSNMIRL